MRHGCADELTHRLAFLNLNKPFDPEIRKHATRRDLSLGSLYSTLR